MYNEQEKQAYEYELDLLEHQEPYAVALAREIIDTESYNGWVNRETCVIAMHLSSDYELLKQTLEKIGEAGTAGNAAVAVERWVKEQHSILHHEPPNRVSSVWLNVLADAGSLWRVDWQEIVGSFTEY